MDDFWGQVSDYVSDRRGHWFEPNTGSQERGPARKHRPSLLAFPRDFSRRPCVSAGASRLFTGPDAAAASGGKRQRPGRKKQGAGRPPRGRAATMFLTGRVVGSSPTRGAKREGRRASTDPISWPFRGTSADGPVFRQAYRRLFTGPDAAAASGGKRQRPGRKKQGAGRDDVSDLNYRFIVLDKALRTMDNDRGTPYGIWRWNDEAMHGFR